MWPFDRRVRKLRNEVEQHVLEEALRLAEPDADTQHDVWNLLQSMRAEGETPQTRKEIVQQCRIMQKTNSHVRGLIRTYVKYICRGGFQFDAMNEAEGRRFAQWNEANNWVARQKQIVARTIRDGECMVWWQVGNSGLVARFIDPLKINNNHANTPKEAIDGIVADPEDSERALDLYHEDYGQIKASDVSWYRSDDDLGCTRAWPWFFILASNAKLYAAWLNDRIRLNRLRTAVAMIRKHPRASASQIKAWLESQKNTQSETTDTRSDNAWLSQERWHGAQIFDLKGEEDIDFKSPNLGAGDAQQDGRALLLTLPAATGLAEYMTTGDAGNNNYASSLVAEAPAVAEFEDWQLYFASQFKLDWYRVQEYLQGEGADWKPVNDFERVSVQAPRVSARERDKEANANNTLHDGLVISLAEWRRREGVDGKQMDKEIKEEAAVEVEASTSIDGSVHEPEFLSDGSPNPKFKKVEPIQPNEEKPDERS